MPWKEEGFSARSLLLSFYLFLVILVLQRSRTSEKRLPFLLVFWEILLVNRSVLLFKVPLSVFSRKSSIVLLLINVAQFKFNDGRVYIHETIYLYFLACSLVFLSKQHQHNTLKMNIVMWIEFWRKVSRLRRVNATDKRTSQIKTWAEELINEHYTAAKPICNSTINLKQTYCRTTNT